MIREYDEEKDYPTLKSWWEAHGWEGVNPGLLGPVAFMCYDERSKVDLAFCVIWPVAGKGIAIMEWMVANPEISPLSVFKALRELTLCCEDWCRGFDYNVLFTSCRQPSLAKVHQRNGFTRTDDNMIHLVKVVEGNN